MEMEKGARELPPARIPKLLSIFHLLFFLLLVSVLLGGCASPGEPLERRPPTPAAVTDLAAQQSGNNVVLTFTQPRDTVDHRPLKQPLAIDVYRRFSASNPGSPSSAPRESPSLLVTIPPAMVSHYAEQGRIRYVDALQPDDFTRHPNEIASYTVRTRVSEKKPSPDSNVAALQVYPAPDPIDDLKAQVVHSGVVLAWTPPQKTPVGPAPPIETYRIYRTEIAQPAAANNHPGPDASSPALAGAHVIPPAASRTTKLRQQPVKIAEAASPTYEDEHAEFGKTYTYSVRSVVPYSGNELESSDSNLVTITPRDVFPPAAPQGLVAVFVPALGETPAHLELSWAISPETDIAGYNIYRSEQEGTLGAHLNSELLLTPAFRDMSEVAGRQYFYIVTAVDRSGNESSPSAPASGEVPAESQP